jgi:glyoxylase-like metal-dependent hydrolase (beta-lactamase superfamily II)
MGLEVKTFTLGPLENNTFLLWEKGTKQAILIDPTYEIQTVIDEIQALGLHLSEIWITHAHFDHVIGIPLLLQSYEPSPQIGLHAADLGLWRADAGAQSFNLHISLPKDPDFFFEDRLKLTLGTTEIEVRHVPGHTPGHVIFFISQKKIAFCGDVLFYHSIGRTDLPGGNFNTLIDRIRSEVLSLPLDTRLLCGHGPETTVFEEKENNPFLK